MFRRRFVLLGRGACALCARDDPAAAGFRWGWLAGWLRECQRRVNEGRGKAVFRGPLAQSIKPGRMHCGHTLAPVQHINISTPKRHIARRHAGPNVSKAFHCNVWQRERVTSTRNTDTLNGL